METPLLSISTCKVTKTPFKKNSNISMVLVMFEYLKLSGDPEGVIKLIDALNIKESG